MTQSSSDRSQLAIEARRRMLKLGTCGAMTNASFLSTLMHLEMTNKVMGAAAIPPTGGYKALVCLFFSGAIDSYNYLTPYGTTQGDEKFTQYAGTRTGAAHKRRDLANGIDDGAWVGTDYGYLNKIVDSAAAGGTGRTYGLHPRFVHLKNIYDAGDATFVANTGALVDPIKDNSEYVLASKIKPLGLFSHNDQQRAWQTAVPTSRNQVRGWAGNMADLFTDPLQRESNVFTCVSLAGQSLLLNGNRIFPYAISTAGAVLLNGYNQTATAYDRVFTKVQNDLASQTYVDLLEGAARDETVAARDSALAFQSAFNGVTLPTTPVPFGTTGLGGNLAAVAKVIKTAQTTTAPLSQQRQIFMVNIGGWDHHASLLANQNNMIPAIDNGLKAFYDFLVAENMLDKVTLFSISDFSRTLQFNGSGTDHAWGACPIVMGGAVNGTPGNNRIWGTYPDIVLNTTPTGIDRGRGVLIPSTSTDVYHSELCRWFGVGNDSNLQLVLPNIRNFMTTGGSGRIPFLNY